MLSVRRPNESISEKELEPKRLGLARRAYEARYSYILYFPRLTQSLIEFTSLVIFKSKIIKFRLDSLQVSEKNPMVL